MSGRPHAQAKSGKPLESSRGRNGKQVHQPTATKGTSKPTQGGRPRTAQTNNEEMKEKQARINPSSKGAAYADGPNGYGHKQTRYDAYDHSARPGESHVHQDHKAQAMIQMQRAAEASKQLLYGVYGNFISILEEYEARTHEAKARRSKIPIPDQSRKNVDDVQSIVQTQLLLFETQQRACPKAISQSVNKELRQRTLHWVAVRDEHKMPYSDTDRYICQLYEVLAKGKTKHEILDQPRESVSEETIKKNVQYIFKGKHEAMEIDQEFKKDDKKKATSPETRRSGLDDAYTRGAHRMTQVMPELVAVLEEDLKEFEGDGIEDTE
ncbi:uncharacterized protein LOC127841966 [Dreissena polymorpha]|uniref:Uncharacterized protein n=1 Tax=Dreissena polymorpha TaxID=45954 RepID=A0A9D4ITI3_DREPO|nr:uncharacterized protein LOC127841966 [Dreissena polymorpha]KAH3783618.1 hypothetical protein DPMN_161560 [Dreissena polymorpha]